MSADIPREEYVFRFDVRLAMDRAEVLAALQRLLGGTIRFRTLEALEIDVEPSDARGDKPFDWAFLVYCHAHDAERIGERLDRTIRNWLDELRAPHRFYRFGE